METTGTKCTKFKYLLVFENGSAYGSDRIDDVVASYERGLCRVFDVDTLPTLPRQPVVGAVWKPYIISWVSFFDNELKMEHIKASDDRDAHAQALNRLTGIEDFEHDVEWLHMQASNCDGLIGAIANENTANKSSSDGEQRP